MTHQIRSISTVAITLSTAAKNASADAIVDLIDVGTGTAIVRIKDAADVILAQLNLSNPAFGNAAVGVATANAITDDSSADASGIASKFDATDRDGTVVFDGTVTANGGGGDMTLVSTTLTAGEVVQISSFSLAQP